MFVNLFLSVWDDYYAFDYKDLAKVWNNHHESWITIMVLLTTKLILRNARLMIFSCTVLDVINNIWRWDFNICLKWLTGNSQHPKTLSKSQKNSQESQKNSQLSQKNSQVSQKHSQESQKNSQISQKNSPLS